MDHLHVIHATPPERFDAYDRSKTTCHTSVSTAVQCSISPQTTRCPGDMTKDKSNQYPRWFPEWKLPTTPAQGVQTSSLTKYLLNVVDGSSTPMNFDAYPSGYWPPPPLLVLLFPQPPTHGARGLESPYPPPGCSRLPSRSTPRPSFPIDSGCLESTVCCPRPFDCRCRSLSRRTRVKAPE